MEKTFRIFDFNIYNETPKELKEDDTSSNAGGSGDDLFKEKRIYKDTTEFFIQIFGINEEGKTSSIVVKDFKPFFYLKVSENWNILLKNAFLEFLKHKLFLELPGPPLQKRGGPD